MPALPIYREGTAEAKERIMAEELETEVVEEDDVTPENILGAIEPEGDEPEAETPTEDDSTAEAPEGAEEPEQETETAEEPAETPEQAELVNVTFEQGGVQYTLQLPHDEAQALEKLNTTASQFPNLQTKYTNLLEESRAPADARPEPRPEVTQDQFLAAMEPHVKAAVQRGTMSEDFAELYPAEAAWGMWLSDTLMKVQGVVGPITQHVVATTHDAEVAEYKANAFNEMQKLAGESSEVFGDLAQPTTREAYLDFMIEMDLPITSLQGEAAPVTLKRMWGAFRADELQAAAKVAAEHARAEQEEERRLAGGAGGGGGARSQPKDPLADIVEVLTE
jgi:hypothetical protein